MEKTIQIPDKVEVDVERLKIRIKGEKGELEKDFTSPLFKEIQIIKDDKIIIKTKSNKRKIKSMVGTITSHINNMIKGVTEGYTCELKIVYVHFPFTVKVSENKILIDNFLGEKAPRKSKIVGDSKVEVKGSDITVSGINKEEVGQTSANMEIATKIKRRDRRVFQDCIVITKKPK